MPRKSKKYHYIYKTTCSLTKRFYYGMHSTDNLDDNYLGSGTELIKSIKRYGKEYHIKEILEYLDNRKELKKREAALINEEVKKDPLCMNLAKGGGGSDYMGELVCVKDGKGNIFVVHCKDSRYISGELVGVKKGMATVKDKDGNCFNINVNDPRYLSGELVGSTKGIITVKDKHGNKFSVSIDEPRYLSGELINISKGQVTVKDKDGNCFKVDKNDPRYLSGELKSNWYGRKHTEETKRKIRETIRLKKLNKK